MVRNLAVPFTIVKEKNGDNHDAQYKWKKELQSPRKLNYEIQNINLVQDITETLSMSITLSQHPEQQPNSVDKTEGPICSRCGVRLVGTYCLVCQTWATYSPPTPEPVLTSFNANSIFYELEIEFHNYTHEFSRNYCYEVVCQIPRKDKPDEYLFHRVEPRLNKAIIFKKCYISTACSDKFNDLSSSNLYFGVRRFNNQTYEMTISALLSVISTLQNTDGKNCKITLQAKDGKVTVYKSILAQHSDVFRAMFAHDMKEKQDGVIDIASFEAKVVQKMVDYLYTGKLGGIAEMTQELFKLAHEYKIHELRNRCKEYYIFNVDINNNYIVEMLELIDLYELNILRNKAENFVKRYESDVSKLPSYQKYLCQSINIVKAVNTLILADKYRMVDVKTSALDFIKINFDKMSESKDFLQLFQSNPRLMEDIYVHSFQNNE